MKNLHAAGEWREIVRKGSSSQMRKWPEDDGTQEVIYQGNWRYSREIWCVPLDSLKKQSLMQRRVCFWSGIKVIVYFLFMAGAHVSTCSWVLIWLLSTTVTQGPSTLLPTTTTRENVDWALSPRMNTIGEVVA